MLRKEIDYSISYVEVCDIYTFVYKNIYIYTYKLFKKIENHESTLLYSDSWCAESGEDNFQCPRKQISTMKESQHSWLETTTNIKETSLNLMLVIQLLFYLRRTFPHPLEVTCGVPSFRWKTVEKIQEIIYFLMWWEKRREKLLVALLFSSISSGPPHQRKNLLVE